MSISICMPVFLPACQLCVKFVSVKVFDAVLLLAISGVWTIHFSSCIIIIAIIITIIFISSGSSCSIIIIIIICSSSSITIIILSSSA